MAQDLVSEYRDYLARFESTLGPSEFGAFVKHDGKLVKKLRFEEFQVVYGEYAKVEKTYYESLERGDTINDVVVKQFRDRATYLLLPSPV